MKLEDVKVGMNLIYTDGEKKYQVRVTAIGERSVLVMTGYGDEASVRPFALSTLPPPEVGDIVTVNMNGNVFDAIVARGAGSNSTSVQAGGLWLSPDEFGKTWWPTGKRVVIEVKS
jgi:hypothetical protein